MSPKRSLGPQPLLYPEPVLLVATYDEQGQPNVMTAAWGGICNSEPVSLMIGVRPSRHTHRAVMSRKAFTVGIATEEMAAAADYVGIVSGRRQNKFMAAGYTAVRSDKVDAPYIAECPVILECALTYTLELGTHTLMVGQIMDVKADEDCLNADGVPDFNKFRPLIFDSGTRRYYGMGNFVADAFSVGKPLIKNSKG